MSKVNIDIDSPELKEKIIEALLVVSDYPVIREQMRCFCADYSSKFNIECNSQGDEKCEVFGAVGLYQYEKNKIILSSKMLVTPEKIGYVLIHEMLHAYQDEYCDIRKPLVLDMETMVMSRQL